MLCQLCKQNEATTHIKNIVNGEFSECYMCRECATKKGYNNLYSTNSLDINSFLGSFLNTGLPPRSYASRCELCGISFSDIAKTGKVGCANCYETFYNELYPSIKKMHGNTTHNGKVIGATSKELRLVNEVEKLKDKLQTAVVNQEFEKAAKIRDEIKLIESKEDK